MADSNREKKTCEGADMTEDIHSLDATAQAELIREGKMSSEELVDSAIERIERLNPKLNAVIIPLFDKARDLVRSGDLLDRPFRGVPMLLKDLGCATQGDPHHSGMQFLKKMNWIAPSDAFLATKLRQAGFVVLGRTNTPELGLDGVTEPIAYGPTRNPWNLDRAPGGSSGGSAAAVASGMVPVAHGSDAGGSIRNPASSCGLVGLKPSRGRTSFGPDYGEVWGGLSVDHVLTRSVRDTAAVLDVTAGPMPGDPYHAPPPDRPFRMEVGCDPGKLRIGVMARAPGASFELPSEISAAVLETGELLRSLGHSVEESCPEPFDSPEAGMNWFTYVSGCIARELDRWQEITGHKIGPDDIEPANWAVAEIGRGLSAREYLATKEAMATYSRNTAAWWSEGFDLLLAPTIGSLPPLIGEFESPPDNPLEGMMRTAPIGAYTIAFNITGQPAISLPLHWTADGLPVGVQLAASYAREDLLIRVASQLEQARPWKNKWPPLSADLSS
jgi:amidase